MSVGVSAIAVSHDCDELLVCACRRVLLPRRRDPSPVAPSTSGVVDVHPRRSCRTWLASLSMATLVAWSIQPMVAQTVTAPVLKAAFLYNLAKFAEWPSEVLPNGGVLTICVLGDASVADTLGTLVKGHAAGDHAIAVSAVSIDGTLRSCQLLYVSVPDSQNAMRVLNAVSGAPILTVSDLDRFAHMGGIAQFFMEGDKMRFAINTDAAHRSHLHLSSKLLALAKIVTTERSSERRDGAGDSLTDSTSGRR